MLCLLIFIAHALSVLSKPFAITTLWGTADPTEERAGYQKKIELPEFGKRQCIAYLKELKRTEEESVCCGFIANERKIHTGYEMILETDPKNEIKDIPKLIIKDENEDYKTGKVSQIAANIKFTKANQKDQVGAWNVHLFDHILKESGVKVASLDDNAAYPTNVNKRKVSALIIRIFRKKDGPGWYQTFGYQPQQLNKS